MTNIFYIHEIIRSDLGVSSEDGEMLYSMIKDKINKNCKIILSFKDIYIVTSAFLNAAIGLIPRDFKDSIDQYVDFQDLSEDNKKIVDMIIANAQKYYQNPDLYDSAFESMLEN